MTLGTRLRERRERFGKTQLDAARELGISNVQLSRYESDGRKPDPEMLGRFAEYYRTSADYLLGLTDDPTADTYAPPPSEGYSDFERFINDPEHGAFFKEFLNAPEESKEEMRRFWEYLQVRERGRKPGDRQGE
ncbi:helix-turn-helix domain-containing protein [Cohnella lubricantis]|uniref:Helix-turn-helix domain-containing protein n=1 Tax=Cohnella lubricantis TaxID=2163172 RepID=A0A841TJH5_9BACL|nr:helix-turn-helix domain-containing protein [Cohnella lubricantis]MBB6678651.1 helix-turn-helix domain-containing protein [Cohnella lubricantis]MBP2119189.1 transcriptional regulator with XRE-family HTH domain [Cohnella lubricantis]